MKRDKIVQYKKKFELNIKVSFKVLTKFGKIFGHFVMTKQNEMTL